MKRSSIHLITVAILTLQNLVPVRSSAAQESKLTSHFILRTRQSSAIEFEALLKKHALLSYTDWYLFEAKNRSPDTKRLDEALEMSMTQPLMAYESLGKTLEDLQSHLLSQESLELMVSILIKMSELRVPERLQVLASRKAKDLIATHKSLNEISSYKQLLNASQAQVPPMKEKIEKQQLDIAVRKVKKLPGLEDAVLLVDGLPVSDRLPEGEHQWALLSNTSSPVLVWGVWDDFARRIFKEDALEPLAEGECNHTRIISNDYQVQTQGRVFSKTDCFEVRSSKEQIGLPAGTHLSDLPQVESTDHSYGLWIATGLVVAAGLIYGLKNKSVSFRMPGKR